MSAHSPRMAFQRPENRTSRISPNYSADTHSTLDGSFLKPSFVPREGSLDYLSIPSLMNIPRSERPVPAYPDYPTPVNRIK